MHLHGEGDQRGVARPQWGLPDIGAYECCGGDPWPGAPLTSPPAVGSAETIGDRTGSYFVDGRHAALKAVEEGRAVAIVGILLGLVLLFWLPYRAWSVLLLAPASRSPRLGAQQNCSTNSGSWWVGLVASAVSFRLDCYWATTSPMNSTSCSHSTVHRRFLTTP